MTLESAFRNLDSDEFERAKSWFQNLREPETSRIINTFKILHSTPFNFHDYNHQKPKHGDDFAIIVAGTSIDTEDYHDIDIFLLTQDSLSETYHKGRVAPRTAWLSQGEGILPDHVYAVDYGNNAHLFDVQPADLIKQGLGALVTVSLLNQSQGFREPRKGSPTDITEAHPPLGAEGLMKYNRERQAKFVPVGRTYQA